MVRVLIECAESFGVEDKYVDRFSFRCCTLNGFTPDPNTLFSNVINYTIDLISQLSLTTSSNNDSTHSIIRNGDNNYWSLTLRRYTYLCAWVDRWSNPKAPGSIEKHSVEEIALACSIHACNWDNSHRTLQMLQYIVNFLVYFKF